MPIVSIVMAVHNGEAHIKDSIQSILKQSYSNFEIIVIINCSTDNTKKILNNFNDARIKIFETNICQLAFNLNYGLDKAKGSYIVRIDADDIAEPQRVERQLQVMLKHDYDIVGSNLTYIDEYGQEIGEKKYPELNSDIRRSIIYASPIAHPSVMYKKAVVLKHGGYLNGRVSEDYDLWLRLMRDKEIKFYNMQENLTRYRIHTNQAKGNKLAYHEVAGYMIREALYQKSIKHFIGFCVYILKSIFN